MGKTSKGRMKKLQERRTNNARFDIENHREKERKRIAKLRKKQKVPRSQYQDLRLDSHLPKKIVLFVSMKAL